jgi:acetolactate synthase-1/2/3 large subunit
MILFVGDVARDARDREGFQEVDLPAMFAPLAKWAARIDDAARIPEYVARAYQTAMSGRPGPVVLALPEDMLSDQTEAHDRPRVEWTEQPTDKRRLDQLTDLLSKAERPIAIVGGAAWAARASRAFTTFATRSGMPVAAAFRRQDALPNHLPFYAGNLGYGPSPKLVARVKDADLLLVIGARLGEATTDGYTLITPDHPDQTLIHVHPDPNELGSVYRTDLAICADVANIAEALGGAGDKVRRWSHGVDAHAEWLAWSEPAPRVEATLDLGQCIAAMRTTFPVDTIICNGAGNFSAWVHRYWRYAGPVSQLAPTAGAMGYGVPAGIAAALREPERQVVVVAGDGDFLMTGQELATAMRHKARLLFIVVDNGSYGTIRAHQERCYPTRVSGTDLVNPDFAALARAYGLHAETVTTTAEFAPALERARAAGIALLHLKTDIEQISPASTVSAIRAG